MGTFGLLGKKLGHSYSPAIHRLLADYSYDLFEQPEDALDAFLRSGCFDGLNVTMPYKKTVIPYCDEISQTARAVGSVNTLLRRSDGTLYGHNTDAEGFAAMVRRSGICVAGEKVLVLGSGGASVAVCHVLRQLGAAQVVVISRSGENHYGNLSLHADAAVIVNTTPVGMYPNNGASPLSLTDFPRCKGVLDIVYNPERTALCLQAEQLGIPFLSGLYMLVAQAKGSAELFLGRPIPDERVEEIFRILSKEQKNIILIGMPGSGKTTVATALAQKLGRPFLDGDAAFTEAAGLTPAEYLTAHGEAAFRDLECQVLAQLGKRSGCVIATGGGCILREENYASLHQNGTIVYLQRQLDLLPTEGRPLSQKTDPAAMFAQRHPLYQRFADHPIHNCGSIDDACLAILEVLS